MAGLPHLSLISSMLDLGWQLAAIGSELGHHLLVQPDVHARGIIAVAGIAQFLCEVLARTEAGINIERLHQIDNRGSPFQPFLLRGHRLVQNRCDVDGLPGRSRRRAARGCAAAGWSGGGLATEDRAHDFSENTHRSLPMDMKMAWRVLAALSWLPAAPGRDACEFNPPPRDLPMQHSMKRERRCRHLDTVSIWEYADHSVRDTASFGFLSSRLV